MLLSSKATVVALVCSLVSCSAFVSPSRSTRSATSLSMSAALIVQNKGGGHGELGFQLAKNLSSNSKITSITILQDNACNDETEPFKSYSTDLPNVKVVKAPLGDESMTAQDLNNLLGSKYDYVWDNCSKAPKGAGKAVCDAAKEYWDTKLFTYVSSAGMYVPDDSTTFPMDEASTPIKESAGQAQFDDYAVQLGLPLVSFRPQYIYGPKSNKNDYIDWYLDRLTRGEPLPIPGDGTQLVSLTNSEDVASLLASVLNNVEAAVKQRFFNCGTNELVSYDNVATMCAKAASVETNIQHYDASLGKAKFPFRLTDFYVAPTLAMEILGWEGPKHSLKDDLEEWYYEGYKARGGPTREVDLAADKELFAAA